MNRPAVQVNVCTTVVTHDLCVGCGVCSGICPTSNMPMAWTEFGTLAPIAQGRCLEKCTLCLDVCPFLDQPQNEDDLATQLYGHIEGIKHDPYLGYYQMAYVGYAKEGEFRAQGSSGGMATWFLTRLLRDGVVDKVACVAPISESHFGFVIFDNDADLSSSSSKSAYYPVELSGVIKTILKDKKRYAVIGLPCFLKGIRLAMLRNRYLRDRVVILAGLVCGQVKSARYAEYLVRRAGLDWDSVQSISFRDKDETKPASEFAFCVQTRDETRRLYWSECRETWGSGQFKLKSCNFCDDVFAEVGDVVFMDAWLPEYSRDGKGHSIVVTRSRIAQQAMQSGIDDGEVALKGLPISDVLSSQRGVIYQKRTALSYRLWLADHRREFRPRKRVVPQRPSWHARQMIEVLEDLRRLSHRAFLKQRSSAPGLLIYHRELSTKLVRWRILRIVSRLMNLTKGESR